MTLEAAMIVAQALLKYGPDIARGIASIFSKPEHTLADWEAIFSQVKTYEQMDADSKARTGTT
jgi:hypothetical protein